MKSTQSILYFQYLQEVLRNTEIKFRCKHAACVVYKGRIVSTAVNTDKSHPLQKKYGRYKTGAIYLHAELYALIKASSKLSKKQFKRASLYVIRNGMQGSKPCRGCQEAIKAFGVSKIFHS